MKLTWKKRLENQSELRDFNNWPYIEPYVLSKFKQHKYHRNRQIVARALKGETLKNISKEFDLAASTISYLLTRALGGDENTPPELTTALIPGQLIKGGLRKLPLSQCGKSSGARGAFQYLLNTVPELNQGLELMLTSFVQSKAHSQNLTPQIYHKEFLRLLRDVNWPVTLYPFDQATLAYESCRQHFHKQITKLRVKSKKTARAILPHKSPLVAYEEIQLDAQTTDISTSIHLEINGIFHSLRISRLSLYLVKDVATDCNLAYHLCYTKDPCQADVLKVLGNIHTIWNPLNLVTPGLSYSQGACLPSAILENPECITLNMVRMDNALCHLAHSIRDYVCNSLNATLNFGLPGQPKGRGYIEHGIHLIGKNFHRFASTTGSHPNSPIKEAKKNAKKAPLLTLNALEEILSVLITTHNVTPQERLGGKSPIELLQEHVTQKYIAHSFNYLSNPLSSNIRQKEVNVKLIKKENRRPHINFASLRYTGNCLCAETVLNKKVIVEYNEEDIRTLKVYSLKGKLLGDVYAPRTWQSFPHSINTRNRIKKITKQQRLVGPDPLTGYFDYILANKELPKIATELIRITREFGKLNLSISSPEEDKCNEPIYLSPRNPLIPPWSPDLSNIPLKGNFNEKL